MHCIEPACVSVCPVAALEKLPSGPSDLPCRTLHWLPLLHGGLPVWHSQDQWDKALPLIQKCDFCADRLAKGAAPACGEACPTGALIYGTRADAGDATSVAWTPTQLLPHIYGENEAGGTSMLYLSHVPFKNWVSRAPG